MDYFSEWAGASKTKRTGSKAGEREKLENNVVESW